MDTLTFVLVIQVALVGLFVWLLWDTRREAREREKRAAERELQLIAVAQTHGNTLPVIADRLHGIEQILGISRAKQ